MQPAKKNLTKVLSAISMAAAATVAAKASGQILITPYYGQGISPDPNGVFISSSSTGAGAIYESVNSSGTPTTISMPVGDYLFLACDAVVTGDSNPDGTKTTGSSATKKAVQPSFLGLSSLNFNVISSDTNGSMLNPLNTGIVVGTYGGVTSYYTTANVNDLNNSNNPDSNTGYTVGNNSGGGFAPSW